MKKTIKTPWTIAANNFPVCFAIFDNRKIDLNAQNRINLALTEIINNSSNYKIRLPPTSNDTEELTSKTLESLSYQQKLTFY